MPIALTAAVRALVDALSLAPHPEGGYFREVHRASEILPREVLAGLRTGHDGPRSLLTSILYLLPAGEVSRLHRVRSQELWSFHTGDALELFTLTAQGEGRWTRLGPRPGEGDALQHVVAPGVWQGARVAEGGSHALVGCVVVPGFDFADFEMADAAALVRAFPRHEDAIRALTLPRG